ncbi:MAG: hypothetical protein NT019_02685 [Candidatus Adlerbacteria bacterium]|nr:hypothetical protein [Candidatus Adlerbacteria bacterium]
MSDLMFWSLIISAGALTVLALVATVVRKSNLRRPRLEGLDAAALLETAREQAQRYRAIPIALGAVLFLFLVMNQAFPNFTAGYVAQGGPVWMLLFGVLVIGAIITWTQGNPRAILGSLIIGVFGLWMAVATVSSWIWGTNTAPATASAAASPRGPVYPTVPSLPAVINYFTGCSPREEDYEFGTNWKPFPGGCYVDFWYLSGECAMYKETEDGPEDGPYGFCPGSKGQAAKVFARFAKSHGTSFTKRITIKPPG